MTTGFKLIAGRPTIDKDPQALLDYTLDFTDWLDAGDTISTVSFVCAGVTEDHHSIVGGNKVVVWLAGGTVGQPASCTVHVTTAAGRVDDRTMYFRITQR